MADEKEGRVQEIERSLETLESQVRAQIARTQAGARAVLVIGIIIIAVVFGYMTYVTSKIKELATPETLAQMAEDQIMSRVEEYVQTLETTLTGDAEKVVATVREKAIDQIPEIRERVEGYAESLIDQYVDQLEGKIEEVVGEVIEMKRAALDPLIAEAAKPGNDEKIAEEFTDGLRILIEPKLAEVTRDFDQSMTLLEKKLDRLQQPGARLMPEELVEKEAITSILIFINDSIKSGVPAVEGLITG